MKTFLLMAALVAASLLPAQPAQAGSWILGRQVYPAVPYQLPQPPRRAYLGPFTTRPEGAFMHGSFRILRNQVNVGGQLVDQYNVYESYIQGGVQF